jgi:diguanylate cyclase (GGDEF)-like protein
MQQQVPVGEADLAAARGSFQRTMRLVSVGALVATCSGAFLIFTLASTLVDGAFAQRVVCAVLLAVVSVPVVFVSTGLVTKRVGEANAIADGRQQRLDEERRHRDLEAQVADGLEMAESEPEALRLIERSFATVLPGSMTELLLADNSHAHLTRKAAANLGAASGCSVSSPQECPAARRARTHRFHDSEALNACPKLAGRPSGPSSAVCIPVSVMGRTVGVIHTVGSVASPVGDATVDDLQSIANQSGTRLGMLRVMAETQLQASTDGLTGLLNRRAFENGFLQLRERSATGVIVMADLDHFKTINDTYGHETGDRALRVFADTLRKSVRNSDLLARRGGEEFAVIFPDCELPEAVDVLERVRLTLQSAVREAGLPSFTSSFGATLAFLAEDLDLLLARADAALFEAKNNGRDRIVTSTRMDLDEASSREILLAYSAPAEPPMVEGYSA